ncbi:MAG TPA: thymidine phosphorylase family protein, partial [Gemmatimonadaceae bacterium]|nr:thymidine phosphorylase family protein [Gemmatimonadaceae bacterium]
YQELVIFMASECPVCRSEGWGAQSRVKVSYNGRSIIATLNVTTESLLARDEASLSEAAWTLLGAKNGDLVRLSHSPPVESLSQVRAKVYGEKLSAAGIESIVRDIVAGRYSDIDLAAFVTVFAGAKVDSEETTALTRAMIDTGERLYWGRSPVVDKHCVGGLPGNRTSMVVVPIVAACGLTMPKTSSRAITSPAGTADAMETIAPVDLDLAHMRRVVEHEGACVVWGGRVRLAPADDVIISVERPLDFDSGTQLVASVLSKKAAAGSTHVVIDIPIGPTAKVRSTAAADVLESMLVTVGTAIGLSVRVVRTDGTQPVGRGIGPALEARDVLAVLRRCADAPADLLDRSLFLAGEVLETGGATAAGAGRARAQDALESGAALRKFEAICAAQGGMREPAVASLSHVVRATRHGRISGIDNRRLARLAKLAGAPRAASAGVELHARLGTTVQRDEPLMTIHAETPGEMDYARGYLAANPQVIDLEEG